MHKPKSVLMIAAVIAAAWLLWNGAPYGAARGFVATGPTPEEQAALTPPVALVKP